MHYGILFISKVIDSKDAKAFVRFNLEERDFPSKGERDAYRFIESYAERNRGETPDHTTLAIECPEFD